MQDTFLQSLPWLFPDQDLAVQKIPCYALVVNSIRLEPHVALWTWLCLQHPPWCWNYNTTDCLLYYSTGNHIEIFPDHKKLIRDTGLIFGPALYSWFSQLVPSDNRKLIPSPNGFFASLCLTISGYTVQKSSIIPTLCVWVVNLSSLYTLTNTHHA